MEQAAAERRYAILHESQPYHDGQFKNWAAKPSVLTPYHFGDGVRIYVAETDVNPNDQFLPDLDDTPEPA